MKPFVVTIILFVLVVGAQAGAPFVNWESPHGHPMELTPDGRTLLVVNTADARLEVFDTVGRMPVHFMSIPVGLDPVTVRARSNSEVWVVNHISDSITVVDLLMGCATSTIGTSDEPVDVVFAGTPTRAFVTCSQANLVQVFDVENEHAELGRIPVEGEDPRGLAVSSSGDDVFVAIFESGNRSTILAGGAAINGSFPPNAVSDPLGPYGGVNPPPNDGTGFSPAQNVNNPSPPAVALIVRQDSQDRWMDDNGADWADFVSGGLADHSGRIEGWTLADHDLAIIDANTLSTSYVRHLMNICMAVATNPATGLVGIVGTDSLNEIRYEPNLNGTFLRVQLAMVDTNSGVVAGISDLNPHLDYSASSSAPQLRRQSVGDPRSLVWEPDGSLAYVAGMGSNTVVMVNSTGQRMAGPSTIDVGQGPTGMALHDAHRLLYVLNRFEASISVVDPQVQVEIERIGYFDPTPEDVRRGRTFLYDTHATSGHGHVSCASCHVDARTDRLAWDLGNPAGPMKAMDQNCNFGSEEISGFGPCQDWHPMKGPMVTTTLQDIIGKEPLHWRGDRSGLADFNQAYMTLLGDDEMLNGSELALLRSFLASLYFPPNPFRDLDNTLPDSLALPRVTVDDANGGALRLLPPGHPDSGLVRFTEGGSDLSCSFCHTIPTGMGTDLRLDEVAPSYLPGGTNDDQRHAVIDAPVAPGVTVKIPQLRNLYEKIGFDLGRSPSLSGFGYLHDGAVDSLSRFMGLSGSSDQDIADVVSFVMAFAGSDLPTGVGKPVGPLGPSSNDTHAGVGSQRTVGVKNRYDSDVQQWLIQFQDLADPSMISNPRIGLIAKSTKSHHVSGYVYLGQSMFQSDADNQEVAVSSLLSGLQNDESITFTVVPRSMQLRLGVNRDGDGFFDGDEAAACSAADLAMSIPSQLRVAGDTDFDHDVDIEDYRFLRACLDRDRGEACDRICTIDANADTIIDLRDVAAFLCAFHKSP